MAIYRYKGKNRAGTIVEGERVARTPGEVIAALEKESIQVLNVNKKKVSIKMPFAAGMQRKKVSLRELSVFNRQLSVMFNAGLPITQGLGILATQQKNKYFQEVLNEVRKEAREARLIIDPGEAESTAFILQTQKDISFCTCDKASIRLLAYMNLENKSVSLEKALKNAGHHERMLPKHNEASFKECVKYGKALRVQFKKLI